MRTLLFALALFPNIAMASDWTIAEIDGQPTSGPARLSFAADGTLSGSTGCNRFNGQASASGGQLTVGTGLAMTRRACVGEVLATQEMRIATLLQGDVAMQADPFADTLTLAGNGVTALLTPGVEGAVPDMVGSAYLMVSGVDATLNIRADASTGSGVVAHAALGQIMKNLGCEERSDRTWCRVGYIDGSGLEGWAAAEYLAAATVTRRAGAELFDEIGRLPCRIPSETAIDKCDFGVAREADGSGAILVYLHDNNRLLLEFRGTEINGIKTDDGVAEVVGQTNEALVVTFNQAEVDLPLLILEPQ